MLSCCNIFQPEFYCTRIVPPITATSTSDIFALIRHHILKPFSAPVKIQPITSFAKAVTIAPDQQTLYYQKKENNIPAKRITLPHTKIQGEISSDRYLLRDNITPDGHGVMPAYYTVPVVEELINNIDKAKQIALELIRKGGSH